VDNRFLIEPSKTDDFSHPGLNSAYKKATFNLLGFRYYVGGILITLSTTMMY